MCVRCVWCVREEKRRVEQNEVGRKALALSFSLSSPSLLSPQTRRRKEHAPAVLPAVPSTGEEKGPAAATEEVAAAAMTARAAALCLVDGREGEGGGGV